MIRTGYCGNCVYGDCASCTGRCMDWTWLCNGDGDITGWQGFPRTFSCPGVFSGKVYVNGTAKLTVERVAGRIVAVNRGSLEVLSGRGSLIPCSRTCCSFFSLSCCTLITHKSNISSATIQIIVQLLFCLRGWKTALTWRYYNILISL